MFKVQHTPLSFAFALAALLAAGPASAAPFTSGEWLASEQVAGCAEVTAEDRERLAPLLGLHAIGNRFEQDGASWCLHRGDLKVAGNLSHPGRLLVDGTVGIAGSYDDGGEGVLIVLGDLAADDNVLTGGALYVQGAVRAAGLVFGEGGRDAFEVDGGVTARGIVMAAHRAAYAVTAADFVVDEGGEVSDGAVVAMGRRLLPELFAGLAPATEGGPADLALLWPSFAAARELARSGKSLFRAQEAPASLEADLALAAAAGSGDAALLPLVGRDPLVDRLLATRPGLSRKLTRALAARRDAEVAAGLAGQGASLGRLGGADQLTVAVAERLVANPDTPEPTLAQIAAAAEPAVRRTLAPRVDLSKRILRRLAHDGDPGVRAEIFSQYDNAARLLLPEQGSFAKDPDPNVRAAVAGAPPPYELSRQLAADPNRAVRLALAGSLAREVDLPFPQLKAAHREELAAAIYGAAIAAAPADTELASAVFVALPPARQLAIYREAPGLDWAAIARATRSPELLRALLDRESELEIQGNLAANLALPVPLQLEILARASPRAARPCSPCLGFSSPDDVVAELLANVNVAPPALEAARRLLETRPRAVFASALAEYQPLAQEDLDLPIYLVAEKSKFGKTWEIRSQALEVYLQRALRAW